MSVSNIAFVHGDYQPRSVDQLERLNALSPAQAKVARRALDFEEQPSLLGPDSLLRLEDEEVARSMFSGEKKQRKHLWDAIEWEPVPEAVHTPVPPPVAVQDITQLQADTSDPQITTVVISALKPELQEVAERVRLVVGQRQATTVSLADIAEVVNGKSFTTFEKKQLGLIRSEINRQHAAPATQVKAMINIPTLGEHSTPIAHFGSTPLFLRSTFSIGGVLTSDGKHCTDRKLSYVCSSRCEAEVAPGEQLVVMSHDRRRADSDLLFAEGTHRLDIDPGTYRLERWKDGKRIDSSDVTFDEQRDANLNLSDYADFEFRYNGDPLPKVITRILDPQLPAINQRHLTAVIHVGFDVQALPLEPDPRFDMGPQDLPVGRFEVFGEVVIEISPEGAARVRMVDGDQYGPLGRSTEGGVYGHLPEGQNARWIRVSNGGEVEVRARHKPQSQKAQLDDGRRIR